MFVLETLRQLGFALEYEQQVSQGKDWPDGIDRLLDTPIADMNELSDCTTLREFLIGNGSDLYGVVIDDWHRNAYKTVSECECRICEQFAIDMAIPFTGKSIQDLQNTAPDDRE